MTKNNEVMMKEETTDMNAEIPEEKHPHPYLVGLVATSAYGFFITLFLIVLSKVRLNISPSDTAIAPPQDNTVLVILGAILVTFAMFSWFFAVTAVYTGGFRREVSVFSRLASVAWMLGLILSALSIAGWVLLAVVLP